MIYLFHVDCSKSKAKSLSAEELFLCIQCTRSCSIKGFKPHLKDFDDMTNDSRIRKAIEGSYPITFKRTTRNKKNIYEASCTESFFLHRSTSLQEVIKGLVVKINKSIQYVDNFHHNCYYDSNSKFNVVQLRYIKTISNAKFNLNNLIIIPAIHHPLKYHHPTLINTRIKTGKY